MSLSCKPAGTRIEVGPRKPGLLGAADWLSLAAVLGGGPLDRLCSAGPNVSVLTGMVPMYVLMSAFHAAPWLRLIGPSASR